MVVANYMLIYKGEATDMSQMTEDESAAVMAKWQEWVSRLGSSLVDVGAPFGGGASLVDDGSTEDPLSLSGYSIVEAGDLAEAQSHAKGHPFLSEGKGNYAIEIYELTPVPFE